MCTGTVPNFLKFTLLVLHIISFNDCCLYLHVLVVLCSYPLKVFNDVHVPKLANNLSELSADLLI